MASKKKNSPPDYCGSMNKDKDRFGYVYVSMLTAPAYLGLSLPARQLYTILRAHFWSKANYDYLYKRALKAGVIYPDGCFIFPPSHQEAYGYKDRANVKKYMAELTAAGFIKKVEDNRYRFRPCVYQFAAGWKKSGGT